MSRLESLKEPLLLLLTLLLVGQGALTLWTYKSHRAEQQRLKANQSILLHNGSTVITQTAIGHSQASTPALLLRPKEFRQSADTLLATARQAKIKPHRIMAAATVATQTTTHFSTTMPTDTTIDWHDPWFTLTGRLVDTTLKATITTTDTLDIIVHRVPRRFLFFRFGCREVRLDIINRNPHTRLTYARYYRLVK